jgi:hypothetical protein
MGILKPPGSNIAKSPDEPISFTIEEELLPGMSLDPECKPVDVSDDLGYARELLLLRRAMLEQFLQGFTLESIRSSYDTLDVPAKFNLIHGEFRYDLAAEHHCFGSQTLENANFVLNQVQRPILKVRYSSLFSVHVLGSLMGAKGVNDFVHCIALAFREFISFGSTQLQFFSPSLCDLIASPIYRLRIKLTSME